MKNKVLACEACGFTSTLKRFEDDITEEELLAEIDSLNRDPEVDGFIVQLPLPKHISEQKVIEAIDYRKDVDGFHPVNVGRMAIGLPAFISATPRGILELLRRYHVPTQGRKCVILGRSNIVGKPMAQLMMQKSYGDSTVTVCHSHSATLKEECLQADIIIAAGSHRDRRRYHQSARRIAQERLPPVGRCGFRQRGSSMLVHHPRARWCWPHDHLHAHAQHAGCSQARVLRLTQGTRVNSPGLPQSILPPDPRRNERKEREKKNGERSTKHDLAKRANSLARIYYNKEWIWPRAISIPYLFEEKTDFIYRDN